MEYAPDHQCFSIFFPNHLQVTDHSCFQLILEGLDDEGEPHPAPDAGPGQAVAPAPAAELVEEGEGQPRPARPDRVADGDGPPVHVGPGAVQAQLLLDRQVLGGEGLVDLYEGHVLELEARLAERDAAALGRADAHDLGPAARDAPGDEPPEGLLS